jgi:type IV pilus assembly protein PilO
MSRKPVKKKSTKKNFDSFLDGTYASLDITKKVAILVAAFVLPLAVFYYLVFSPKSQEIDGLKGRKASLEREIESLKLIASRIAEHQAKIVETETKFKIAAVLIPDQKEIPSLLTNISSLATNSGLEVQAFKPRPEVVKDFYSEIPVEIQVKGSYHNYGFFLYQVSKLPRIVTINNTKMGSPAMEAGIMELKTDFNLVTYRFLDQREIEANEQAKANNANRGR